MNKEKIINLANKMYTLINVFEKILIVAIGTILIAMVAVNFVPEGSYLTQSTTLTLGSVALELNDGVLPNQQLQIWRILIGLSAACIILVVIFYAIKIVKKILLPMKEGRPFDESVSKSIRNLGTLVLCGGLVIQIAENVGEFILVQNFVNLMELFKDGVVNRININFTFSLTFLFIAFILYLLSYVFEYGQDLQRESDETL